ncbi:ABC transporter permease [Sandaracinobacteroides saxicola]|uniref:ABC transporter permease n=1 Tax=Sandaracinobacteroides saxicola TaxID=2759707 RepID=A0A7G5IIT5_9SPHN|nr:FtsX-like permease family protein [Sandaracinobacteroides saxicola]QMW23277.1 ABC transporter permease [Sandaracinobacteroides saxicola]
MTELKLILAHLRFFRTRTLLMLATVVLAFFTFGILGSMHFSLNSGDSDVTGRRLIVTHEAGLMQQLPISYLERLRGIPGAEHVSHATWAGTFYREQRDMLMAFAVDPAPWLDGHPDMIVTDATRRAFLADRRSILVSEGLARKYGWKPGDSIPLKSILFVPPAGDPAWTFTIAGTFRSADSGGGRNFAIFHYSYLNQNRDLWRDTVGTFVVSPAAGLAPEALAQRIDQAFAGSGAPTSTATDKAFHAEFFAQFGDVASMIRIVMAVTFLSLILVVTSGMTLSMRQRTRDIGVLRVLGFSDARVWRLVAGQTAVLLGGGAALGLAAASVFNRWITTHMAQILPDLTLPLVVLAQGIAAALLLAVGTALLPTLIALRVRPVQAFAMEQA